jgi:hypothetical protein
MPYVLYAACCSCVTNQERNGVVYVMAYEKNFIHIIDKFLVFGVNLIHLYHSCVLVNS